MQRLTESFEMTLDVSRQVKATDKLAESIQKFAEHNPNSRFLEEVKNYRLWEMPISRYDYTNLNGRRYSKALWERVISEQRNIWEGQVGLADHPVGNNEGAFKESAVVWLDMKLDEAGYVWGTCAFVGEYGKLAEDIIIKGGRVGFSSSGLGDLLENGEVDPRTFLIERCADVVLNPSQSVYGNISNLKMESASSTTRRQQKESAVTNLQDKGNIQESKKVLSKLEEKSFRKQIMGFLQDAETIKDPQAKLSEMHEIHGLIEEGYFTDLKEAVETKIEQQNEIISNLISEATRINESFGVEDNQALKEGVSLLAAEVKVAMEEAKDWEKIATSLSESVKTLKAKLAVTPSANFIATQVDKIKSLEKALKTRDNQISEMKKKAHNIINEDTKKLTENSSSIKSLSSAVKTLKDKLKESDNKNIILANMLKSRTKRLNDLEESINDRVKQKIEESKPVMLPTAKERLGDILQINERSDVESYFKDLLVRHGSSISQFRERFLRCRSLKEAQGVYLKVLPMLNEGSDYYNSINLPQGAGIGVNERKRMVEDAGINIDEGTMLTRLQKRVRG